MCGGMVTMVMKFIVRTPQLGVTYDFGAHQESTEVDSSQSVYPAIWRRQTNVTCGTISHEKMSPPLSLEYKHRRNKVPRGIHAADNRRSVPFFPTNDTTYLFAAFLANIFPGVCTIVMPDSSTLKIRCAGNFLVTSSAFRSV